LDTIVPVSHDGKEEIIFLPLFDYFEFDIWKGLVPDGQFNVLVGIHAIDNFKFPAVNALGEKLFTVGIKPRAVFGVKLVQGIKNVLDQFINGKLLSFKPFSLDVTVESGASGDGLQFRVEYFFGPCRTRLVVGCD
jgi:hypothetical protein